MSISQFTLASVAQCLEHRLMPEGSWVRIFKNVKFSRIFHNLNQMHAITQALQKGT